MEILRYTAFSTDPSGGNPAGVVLDAGDLEAAQMQQIAADVGFSETAFLTPTGPNMAAVRYFDCARIEAARDWLRLDEPGRAGKEST